MNIVKLYHSELRLSILTFIVFIFVLSRRIAPITDSWFNAFVYLLMLWSVYYFTFIRLSKDHKLDERENTIYIKTSHLSSFIFMSVLLILFYIQNQKIPLLNIGLEAVWGWFILPIYILFHGLTGLVLTYLAEK